MADPNAIVVVKSCCDAFDRVGFPEGLYFLTHASLYLAMSPKSNSTKRSNLLDNKEQTDD